MPEDFKAKLRSLSFPRKMGTAERKPVVNEDTGRIGGYQTTHWDDHQDAEIIPEPVTARRGSDGD